ncbi:hypothetical protein ACWDGI_20520 [Streptomyces sp. NPDC001220]
MPFALVVDVRVGLLLDAVVRRPIWPGAAKAARFRAARPVVPVRWTTSPR